MRGVHYLPLLGARRGSCGSSIAPTKCTLCVASIAGPVHKGFAGRAMALPMRWHGGCSAASVHQSDALLIDIADGRETSPTGAMEK